MHRREPVVCGVDIGSTNVKVVALDRGGTVVARAGRPTPRDADGLVIDGTVLAELVDTLIIETCGTTYAAHALCTVGVGEDGLLLDAGLRPLSPALAWFDPRRQGILRELRAQLDDDATFDVTNDAAQTLIGWAWARRQPGAEAGRTWSAIADLPAVRWSCRPFLSDTLASRTGAWRATTRAWALDRVALTLGSDELLPPVLATGDIAGPLRSPELRSAGVVADDAIVVVGGHDHPIGGWAVGLMVPHAVLDSMGTAEVVVTQAPSAPMAPRGRVDVAPGIGGPGTTVLRVVELARNVAWAAQDPAVARWIDALLAGSAEPEPVLDAGYFRPGRRGGRQPSYALSVPRDPRARASAVLGALALAGRQSVQAVCGGADDLAAVRLAGGWTRSPGWIAIKEAVNGYRAETVAEPEVTAVGAALMAARARGWDPDPALALGGAGPARLRSRRC